jgi:signal transduction histidine kinase
MVKSPKGSQMTNLEMPLYMARESIPDIELWAGQVFAESDPLNQNMSKVLKNLDTTSRRVISQLDFLLNFYTDDTRATLERANKLRFNFSIIMILVFFLLALAILGSGFILAREITNPIQKLVQATQRVAAGELTYKVPVSSSDEIGELAKRFNAMTEDLQKYQNKLVANERLATLGTFVSYMSHELRNPLTVLKNCVFHLEIKAKPDNPLFQKYFKMMQEEIDAAKKIIDDCLTFSKDKKLDLKMVNLNDLLEKVLTLTEIPKHIHIRKEFYADPPFIMADESQIHQVAINIVTNAIMAMSDQGELMIITRSGENYHEVEFTDTGPGIPEQNLTKLFDPFFTTKTHGTGLGLAICKFIIESHGGLIWAENAQGRGASFLIRLPFEPAKKLLIRQQHENPLIHANC